MTPAAPRPARRSGEPRDGRPADARARSRPARWARVSLAAGALLLAAAAGLTVWEALSDDAPQKVITGNLE